MHVWGLVDMNSLLTRFQAFYPAVKRAIDLAVSGIALIVLAPLLLLLCLLVRITSSGPSLFWSERTGYKGAPFKMPKLRTMTQCSKIMSRESADAGDICVTPVGYILRKSSLDELPQLWCVFKGEMSLIGPRPLLVNDRATDQRRARPQIFNVKPGITGLAQVNGRSFISMRNKVRYDAFYADRVCLFLDAKILYRTVSTVLNVKLVK